MSGSGNCSTDTVIANETNFYNWLNTGNKACPTPQQVEQAIKAAMAPASADASSVYYNEEKLKSMKKLVEQRTIDVEVAMGRANMVSRPELTASYYDGWFPLYRPMKHGSVAILIGFASFFFTISIMLFLDLLGIKTVFTVYVPFTSLAQGTLASQTTRPLRIVGFLALLFFVLTLYLYFR